MAVYIKQKKHPNGCFIMRFYDFLKLVTDTQGNVKIEVVIEITKTDLWTDIKRNH